MHFEPDNILRKTDIPGLYTIKAIKHPTLYIITTTILIYIFLTMFQAKNTELRFGIQQCVISRLIIPGHTIDVVKNIRIKIR